MNKFFLVAVVVFSFLSVNLNADTGTWYSEALERNINYEVTDAATPLKDAVGKYVTVVYLENLGFEKISTQENSEHINWFLSKGYRVIELDYENDAAAVSPTINKDIIALNDALNSGTVGNVSSTSFYQSYVLFEGYRIARNVSYFLDDKSVYGSTNATDGDSLFMDIAYPASPENEVPVVLTFSYSNSYYGNPHSRLFLGYTLAMFDDSFVQGAPARGVAWAIADHPKYYNWGSGGSGDMYKSYETNPDAAQKVKSAVRTLRAKGEQLGLSGKIGIFGFSRGSDAGSMAVGDRTVAEFEEAGLYQGVDDAVQAAVLGPGVFDFTIIYNNSDDGDSNLESRCPIAWGPLEQNRAIWEKMGSAYLVESKKSAPVYFYYNNDDAPYYVDQISNYKQILENAGVKTNVLNDFGSGHAVPKEGEDLQLLYNFLNEKLNVIEIYDTITVYDTIAVYDTIYSYISVEDTLVIDLTTGVDGEIFTKPVTFKIYPNPAKYYLQIATANLYLLDNASIEIVELNGSVIESKMLNNSEMHIDISTYSKGTYLFLIKQNDAVLANKIVVIK